MTIEASQSMPGSPQDGSKPSDGRLKKIHRPGLNLARTTKIIPGAPAGGATGPRTEAGKRRSSRNATKCAIFSKAALVTGESPKDYETLLRDLRQDLQPEGALENILVETLGVIVWRRKRFLKAESAEINKVKDFFVDDDSLRQFSDAQRHERLYGDDYGIVHDWTNPIVLNKAIEMLTDVLTGFSSGGFNFKEHFASLHKLYGDFPAESPPEGFVRDFIRCGVLASGEPEELERRDVKPEELKAFAIACLEREIKRLRDFKECLEEVESERRTYTAQATLVPKQEVLDRLQRYEAHLSREFDRTLNQLERVQRMRLGQRVPPPIQVELSR